MYNLGGNLEFAVSQRPSRANASFLTGKDKCHVIKKTREL